MPPWLQVAVTVASTLVGGYVFFVRELGGVRRELADSERRITESVHGLDVRLARLEERFIVKPTAPAE